MLALPLAGIVGALGWGGYQVLANKTSDDEAHMRSKAAYLEQVAALVDRRKDVKRPNILIVYYDDLGYGDFGFTGSKAIRTPNIDALAADGVVLTNYHSPSPVCSPSRAGLLTGRLPPRAGVPNVLFPSDSPVRFANYAAHSSNRLPAEEITLAEVLRADGYRTGMVGKWHLGDEAPSLPNNFGFESFYGALYSNDMEPFAIWRNETIELAAPADQTQLDRLYTDEVVRFISASGDRGQPFFLYFAHNFPHVPLHAPQENRGRSSGGLYGDIVEGLDDGVGRIVSALEQSGQLDNTIVIVTSDNGPWFEGSSGRYRGRKGQTFEGGMHVPFLIHWPSGLEGQRSVGDMAMGTDILPTLCDWLDIAMPEDRIIDGHSLRAMLEGKSGPSSRYTYFYADNGLMAVSDGRFKYHPAQPYLYVVSNSRFAAPMAQGPWLFDLAADQDESYNVAMRYPDAAKRLKAALDARNREMTENPRGWN